MSKLAQQLLDNAISLTAAYVRTKDESILEIIQSLLGAVKEELSTQPGIFPALPALPSRHPDSLLPQVTAYAAPDVNGYPWVGTCTTSTTLSVGSALPMSDHIVINSGPPRD
jgi:hypothetical protein